MWRFSLHVVYWGSVIVVVGEFQVRCLMLDFLTSSPNEGIVNCRKETPPKVKHAHPQPPVGTLARSTAASESSQCLALISPHMPR